MTGRLAGGGDAVDVGGLEPGIGHRVERGVGVQADLRQFGDAAQFGRFGGADDGDRFRFHRPHLPFAGRNRGSVISSSIFSKATSSGMSSTSASGRLRAIDDVGHHARPLVELDDGDRVGRREARHRPVVDHIAVEPALAAGPEHADLARRAMRAERARREIGLAAGIAALQAQLACRVPSQKCFVSGVGCGRARCPSGMSIPHQSVDAEIKIDAAAALTANGHAAPHKRRHR